jgi:diguanylate cyclase (GGDEF)-like protein
MEIPDKDLLTGLPTHHLMSKYFDSLVDREEPFGIFLLDIDRFNLFNYYYGHLEGDKKLKQLAKIVCQTVPNNAKVFRSGGDEFTVFLTGVSMAKVVEVAMQVKDAMNQELSSFKFKRDFWFPDKSSLAIELFLSVSCAVAFYPSHGENLNDLRKEVEKAMYSGDKGLNQGGVLVIC